MIHAIEGAKDEEYTVSLPNHHRIHIRVHPWGLELTPMDGMRAVAYSLMTGETHYEVWQEKQIPLPLEP